MIFKQNEQTHTHTYIQKAFINYLFINKKISLTTN